VFFLTEPNKTHSEANQSFFQKPNQNKKIYSTHTYYYKTFMMTAVNCFPIMLLTHTLRSYKQTLLQVQPSKNSTLTAVAGTK